MCVRTIYLFFLNLTFYISLAQPWLRTIKTFTSTASYSNLYYQNHPQFGGALVISKPVSNVSRPTVFSFNNKGDTTFQKVIAFDSIANPGPDVAIVQMDIDSLGNRNLLGILYDWNQPASTVQWFELELDSSGVTISNKYWPAFPWWAYSTNNTNLFSRLVTKNNDAYYFILEDSIVSVTNVVVHKLKRQIFKKDLNGNLQWKIETTEPDVTINSIASQRLGKFGNAIETSSGNIAFTRFDSTMINGPLLEVINPLGLTQYTVPILNFLQSPGNSSYGGFIFPTNDGCVNLYGIRVPTNNPNTHNAVVVKINPNGQMIDSVVLGPIWFENAIQTTTGRIWITYNIVSGGNILHGIIEMDNAFNILNVHPELSLERYKSPIVRNSIGGCFLANYFANPMYTGNHDVEMCNYDSLFNTYPNKLSGQIYKDNNKNCNADAVDENLSWRQVTCTDAQNKSYYGYSTDSGNYRVRIPNGTFTVSHDPGTYKSQICPSGTIALNANINNSIITQNYFDTIVPNINDLKLNFFGDPVWYNSCSFLTAYCQNVGTTTLNATLKVIKDPGLTFSLTIPPANQISGDTAFFYLNSLQPDSVHFVYLNVAPGGIPSPGTSVLFKGILTSTNPEMSPGNNMDSLISLYYGNLKMTTSTPSISSSNNISVNKPKNVQGDEELLYKIKFQNTTGKTVQQVLIVDSLGPYLDPSSLKIIKASHTFSFEVNTNGKMVIWLQTPGLTDSTANESTSKGYLAYTIKPKTSWPLNKKLYNHADIYFDSFHLRTTNVTVNQKIPNAVGQNEFQMKQGIFGVELFPNPAKDFVDLLASSGTGIQKVELHTISGVKLTEINFQTMVDRYRLETLSIKEGVYIVRIYTNKGSVVKKLLINSKGN